MGEFDLIRRLAEASRPAAVAFPHPAAIGIGDDGAVLDVDADHQLVVTADALVAGIHFAADVQPADLGFKALAVNLSDLAAMGADPAWHVLCLAGPDPAGDWLERFAAGMNELATAVGSELAGGDLTGGPLGVTITALGLVPRGQALRRSGASAGDLIVVSGIPGLAALALAQDRAAVSPSALERLLRPQPRLALGRALRGRATACIDVSDGLAADLGHVLTASGLGAELWLDRLPRGGTAFTGLSDEARWNLQLGGGDDYELCFTLPPQRRQDVAELASRAGVELSVIGRTTAEHGSLRCLRADGSEFVPAQSGWDHFREPAV